MAFPVLKHSLGAAVSYHRVSHQSHLGSHQCHRKVSLQAGRWWSRWRRHGERVYTPALHSCLRLSCPHSHCLRRTPRLCWYSVLWTEGGVKKNHLNWLCVLHMFLNLECPHQSPCSQTWQLGRTCEWHLRSSSHRSGPCSPCPRRSANARGCTGRPFGTETHQYDNLQGDAWLWRERHIMRVWKDTVFDPCLR